jgi:hypothetical protein
MREALAEAVAHHAYMRKLVQFSRANTQTLSGHSARSLNGNRGGCRTLAAEAAAPLSVAVSFRALLPSARPSMPLRRSHEQIAAQADA